MSEAGVEAGGFGLAPGDDDLVLPFRAEASGVMGRLVRLGASVDTVLGKHDYPEPVSRMLGEALVLSSLLGAALATGSKLILQTKGDGPVGLVVVINENPGYLRGYASFDRQRVARLAGVGQVGSASLLGTGHLAMTIDPGGDNNSYQGIVALAGQGLIEAALTYFRQSVQLPTFVRIAVARHYSPVARGDGDGWRWRAGGLMVQQLSPEGGTAPPEYDRLKGDGTGYEPDENWERTRMLASTVEDHELLDPTLSPSRLLVRLFHEEGVRAYGGKAVEARCTCSRERLRRLLGQFDRAEVAAMADAAGTIETRCEFCSSLYRFRPEEID